MKDCDVTYANTGDYYFFYVIYLNTTFPPATSYKSELASTLSLVLELSKL